MRKDIRKRLEKALITLQEPGGSTIRSIIKVINKDTPFLSVRKVLEALQEGINEGFLCMYNGRFKLKQQINTGKGHRQQAVYDRDISEDKEEMDAPNSSDSEVNNEKSDLESEDDNLESTEEMDDLPVRSSSRRVKMKSKNQKNSRNRNSKKPCVMHKKKREKMSHRSKKNKSKQRQCYKEGDKGVCDTILEMSSNYGKKSTNRSTMDKPDLKKQRGPRCTSMKKDVRMPSKVHIPFLPPTVPQRSNTFNELLRRSPEPVNGPLFDGYNLLPTPENLGFF